MRVAVLASGRGSNLAALIPHANVVLVVSDQPSPALQVARDHGIEAKHLPGERDRGSYDKKLQALLIDARIDLVVLAGFMRILSADLVTTFAGRIINIHPALLPAFKGAHGVRDTLRSGTKFAGCTTHFVVPDLDAGPIILQAAIPIHVTDTVATLQARVLQLEHQILPRTVQLIAANAVQLREGRVRIQAQGGWPERTPDATYSDGF